jgi:hypothetical protein
VNAGLWLGDPDVDAVTRLALAPRAREFRGASVVLGAGVWSPLNSQNTALARDAARAYYYVRMGDALGGLPIDRFGDILAGYFLQACTQQRGEAVRFGTPVADHRRSPHDAFVDLSQELGGLILLEELLPWLVAQRLEGGSHLEAYASLAEALATQAPRFTGRVFRDGGTAFLTETAGRMRQWVRIVGGLG